MVTHLALTDTAWIGAIIVLAALVLTRLSGMLDQRRAARLASA